VPGLQEVFVYVHGYFLSAVCRRSPAGPARARVVGLLTLPSVATAGVTAGLRIACLFITSATLTSFRAAS
jgi:hypothetical protein